MGRSDVLLLCAQFVLRCPAGWRLHQATNANCIPGCAISLVVVPGTGADLVSSHEGGPAAPRGFMGDGLAWLPLAMPVRRGARLVV